MSQRFAARLQDLGLSKRQEQLEHLVQPAIRISSQLAALSDCPLGRSRFGGLPDLPPDIEWPRYKDRPMALLAQFNLAEVAPHDTAQLLPKVGLLYFFYDMVDQPWGYDSANREGWRVIYSNAADPALTRAPLPQPIANWDFEVTGQLAFSTELTLPPVGRRAVKALRLSGKELDCYDELLGADLGQVVHRLLGYPAELQSDTRWEAQLASNGIYLGSGPVDVTDPPIRRLLPGIAEWRLLFQLDDDNDGGAAWFGGAGGRLYYLIRQKDLQRRDFDHVWVSFHWQ
jgi:uncharacterized protein YwqG